MESLSIDCPKCGLKVTYDGKHAGKRSSCPRCKASIVLPEPEDFQRADPPSDVAFDRKQNEEYRRIVLKYLKTISGNVGVITILICIAFFLNLVGGCIVMVSSFN